MHCGPQEATDRNRGAVRCLLCPCKPIPKAACGRNFKIREMFGVWEEEGKARKMTFAADLYKRAIVPLRTKAPEQNLHRGFSRTVNLYQAASTSAKCSQSVVSTV